MKTSLFSSILCASLMVFAVGCGKENKSGGGSSRYGTMDKNAYNALPQSSKVAWNNLVGWYNSKTEGTAQNHLDYNGIGLLKKYKVQSTNVTPQQNCEEKEFLGIDFTYCYYESSQLGGGSIVPNSETVVDIREGYNLRISEKSQRATNGNPELANILQSKVGRALNVTQTGSVFRLDYLQSDNSVVIYFIDKSYHSRLNPVKKVVQKNGQATETFVRAETFIP